MRLILGFYRHTNLVPNEAREDFSSHLRLTNARRMSVIFAITLASSTLFCLIRMGMARFGDDQLYHGLFITMDIVLIAITLLLVLVNRRIDPIRNPRAHHALVALSLVALPGFLCLISGLEFEVVGGITRFYLAVFALSSAVILTPFVLAMVYMWGLGVLVTTVVFSGYPIPFFLVENSHLIALLMLSGVVSRGVAIAFARDFLLVRELEKANGSLRHEIEDKERVMKRLALSEREFKSTFEFAPDPYLLTDTKGILIRINRCAADVMGVSSRAVLGLSVQEIPNMTDENHALVERTINQTALCGHSGPCQLEAIHVPDQPALYLELHAAIIHVDGKEGVLIVARNTTHRKEGEALLQESRKRLEERVSQRTRELEQINVRLKEQITERIATEAALAKAEHYYRMLVESMNEGLAIFDTEGRFTYANDCLCAMTGYAREDLMGQDAVKVVSSEDHSLIISRRTRRHMGDRTPYEARLATASGKELYIQISPEPIVDEKGHFKGSFVVITNITRLKEMDAALRKSEDRARSLLNASTDAAILLTPSSVLLEANEITCTILGRPREELVGRPAIQVFPDELIPMHIDFFRRAVTSRKTQNFEDIYPGGGNYEITIHPILHNDRVDRVAIFAREITELKRAERQIRTLSQELIKAQESERQRIAMDLHDNVAQDLATLKIGWDTLFDDTVCMPPGTRERIQHLSRLLRSSIQNIRGLAYNLQPPELEQLGLITAMSRFCDEQSALYGFTIDLYTAGVRELTLTFDTQINIYRLVQEALTNVRNHAEATHVTIRLTASHPQLILNFEDNGKGFVVKSRLAEAAVEKRMGVRSMEERVSLLGGTMKLTSSVGEGTRLRVEVPA